jgi:transcriptional regulator with XRE-family HTH domain
MAVSGHLGEFLRARRSALRPEDAGVIAGLQRRRVSGLRREELAQLAGVSASYYTRLEQGHAVNASPAVLDALAGALRLDDHERAYLHTLAARRPRRLERPPAERVSALTRELLRSLGEVPAVLLGRRTDVLAWNGPGHALLAGHVDYAAPDRAADRPNLTRMLFLDSHTRALYADRERKARAVVGNLRSVAGRYPEDARLAALVGELSMASPEFAALWSDYRIKPCEADTYLLRHPLVGELTVGQQTLVVARIPDQSLVLMTTAAGSASENALRLLRHTSSAEPGRAAAPGDGVPGDRR